jgi:hypothetical protein
MVTEHEIIFGGTFFIDVKNNLYYFVRTYYYSYKIHDDIVYVFDSMNM